MKIENILKPLVLRRGSGGSFENGLCFMEAVSWLGGEECSDVPRCACPILGAFAIRLNDQLSNNNRQKLIPLAFDMLGTRSKVHEKLRAEYLLVQVARHVISKSFDKIGLSEIAEKYREVVTVLGVKEVSISAKYAANAAYDDYDAYDAYDAAYGAVYAADAAYAAADAADAADAYVAAAYTADAAYDAADAAYAADAYNAAYAAAFRQQFLLDCIPILQEAIAIGPNNIVDDVVIERALDLSKFAKETIKCN